MTFEEQQERLETIIKAQAMFPLETNITQALRLYKEATGDPIPLFVRYSIVTKAPSPVDSFERPKCPECGEKMFLRGLPKNEERVNTQLVCSNKECDVVLDSELEIKEWLEALKNGRRGRVDENFEEKKQE